MEYEIIEHGREFLLTDNCIVSIYNIFKLLKIEVSHRSIRDFFGKAGQQPPITLQQVCQMLDNFKIRHEVQILEDKELLPDISYPVISHLVIPGRELGFIVLVEALETEVVYINSVYQTIRIPYNDFLSYWSGLVLSVIPACGNEVSHNSGEFILERERKEAYAHKEMTIIDNFLPGDVCNQIVDYCEENALFTRSKVSNNKKNEDSNCGKPGPGISAARTSESAVLIQKKEQALNYIYEKSVSLFNIAPERLEPIQCVKYRPDTYFIPHLDSGGKEHDPRLYTMLIYLNDDFEGGETFFPELGKKIKPKRGTALIFKNMTCYDENIAYSIHAGLPVTKGVKYACNIWVGPVRNENK